MTIDFTALTDEELKQMYRETSREVARKHNEQMMIKILLNSAYGAIASKYFAYFMFEMAESITTSGQLAVRWAAKVINDLMNRALKTEGVDYIIYIDTDSVVGETVIRVNGTEMTIADYFDLAGDDYIKFDETNSDYVKRTIGDVALSVSSSGVLEEKAVNYVMKHRVKKRMFKVVTAGKEVIVTQDHSVIVMDRLTQEMQSVKPADMCNDTHMSMYFDDHEVCFGDFVVEDLGIQEIDVYDIEVEDNHNFFGNDILVHNSNYINCEPLIKHVFKGEVPTRERAESVLDKFFEMKVEPALAKGYDELATILNAFENTMEMKREKINDTAIFCLDGGSIIETADGPRTIESLYETMSTGAVKSYNTETRNIEEDFFDGVTKKPYTGTMLTLTQEGRSVTVTPDHQIYVFRGMEGMWVRADEVLPTDSLVFEREETDAIDQKISQFMRKLRDANGWADH